MTEFSCFYHPNRTAIAKCEQCGKKICLDCKSVYHSTHHNGIGDSSSSYHIQKELCVTCHKVQLEKDANSSKYGGIIFACVACVMFLIFLGGVSSMGGGFGGFGGEPLAIFTAFFVIFIIIAVIVGFASGSKNQEKAKNLGQKIKKIYPNKKIIKKKLSISERSIEHQKMESTGSQTNSQVIFCQQCGNKMDYDAKFCPNCGDTTKDEHQLIS